MSSADHPGLQLYRPLQPGTPVRVKAGVYGGARGVIVEDLTPRAEDAWLNGFHRYAIDIGLHSGALDYARHELATISRERRRGAA